MSNLFYKISDFLEPKVISSDCFFVQTAVQKPNIQFAKRKEKVAHPPIWEPVDQLLNKYQHWYFRKCTTYAVLFSSASVSMDFVLYDCWKNVCSVQFYKRSPWCSSVRDWHHWCSARMLKETPIQLMETSGHDVTLQPDVRLYHQYLFSNPSKLTFTREIEILENTYLLSCWEWDEKIDTTVMSLCHVSVKVNAMKL